MPGCNEANCTCHWTTCPRHGKCCECINHHRQVNHVPLCLEPMVEETIERAKTGAPKPPIEGPIVETPVKCLREKADDEAK